MNDLEKLQELLDNDPEVKLLADRVHACYDWLKPDAKEILSWRDESEYDSVKNIPVLEVFANYKCMLAWACMINKVWEKICGGSFLSWDKRMPIPGTTKKLLLYHFSPTSNNGLNVMFRTDDMKISVREEVDITDDTVKGSRLHGVAVFTLEEPKYTISNIGTVHVNLKDSVMSIGLLDQEPLMMKVSEFGPDKLIKAVTEGYGLHKVNY